MTDYPKKNSNWKAAEARRKWHSILGIFVTVVLLLAFVNGIIKSISFGKNLGKSDWDNHGAFGAVLNTKPVSILVFNPDVKSFTVFKLDEDLYAEKNSGQKSMDKISKIYEQFQGREFTKVIAEVARIPIKHFIYYDSRPEATEQNLQKKFDDFTSIFFPLELIFGRVGGMNTNIAQYDIFRLWWRVKSNGIKDLNLVDLRSNFTDVSVGGNTKVLGVDSVSLHRLISAYFQNEKISAESLEIEVINKSSILGAGQLAADFISSLGGKVVVVESSQEVVQESAIFARDDSYTTSYLARLFQCDIVTMTNLANGKLQIVIGADFGKVF